MSQLRNTLKEIQTDKMLRLLLKDDYNSATEEHKKYIVGLVENQIDNDVDKIINEFLLSYHANDPMVKKDKNLKYIYTIGSVSFTIGIGYAVNQEAWIFLLFLGIGMVLIQLLPFIYNKD